MSARVSAVHAKSGHAFSKESLASIDLVAGHGVAGDAHYGATVQHRSRVARDPTKPNLRQVHLLHEELLGELAASGFHVEPGQLGENVTTSGLNILGLSEGTILRIGEHATVQVTGLRNPCSQIERFKTGLLAAVLHRTPSGERVRKAGVMGVVLASGTVSRGDPIVIVHSPQSHTPLRPV